MLRSQFIRAIRRPGSWLLIAIFLLITFFQYAELLKHPAFLANLTANLGLTRYTVERILYLLPIVWAGFLFGWRGGAITSVVGVACMLPRALFASPVPEDALVETSAVFVVGNLVSYSLESLRKERERRAQIEAAQEELRSHLRIIEVNEKRLVALNQTSGIISRSLELKQVLDSAVDCVMGVIEAEAVQIYILDEEADEIVLMAHRGVSERFVEGAGRLRVGEGFNGRVAKTGEPLFVEDSSVDPRLTKTVIREENIRSQLVVPLISKGKVVGTLCVAMRSRRSFFTEEIDLLTAIGNQIGIAVDNARLYEQLSTSEERYRELFENAHDAIWLHNLEGNILAANKAFVRLTGYDLGELRNLNSVELFSGESSEVARGVEQGLLRGDALGSLDELRIVKKNGTEAVVQLASSLMFNSGQPVGFQHIARDVTEEKRIQENLDFLLRQINQAQEEERKRIARELHDDTLQALVIHSQHIYDLASGVEGLPKHVVSRLEELRQQSNAIMQGLRRLSQDLRPAALDRLGLLPTLRRLAADVAEHSGIAVEVKVLGVERRLPNEVELVLFRIVQEALRNVWKHAQATSAEVVVEFAEGRTKVTVSDNGKGFDAQQRVGDLPRYGKLGLAGMRERARLIGGTLVVRSELGKGTTLIAEAPM